MTVTETEYNNILDFISNLKSKKFVSKIDNNSIAM